MAKRKDEYLRALGYDQGREQQNLPLGQWIVSKVPAAAGGMFAHEVYEWAVEKIFANLVPKYGRDVIGSLGLTIVAYLIDHNLNILVFKRPGFSDDLTQAFTHGMMGRGAPAVWNSAQIILGKLADFLTVKESKPSSITSGDKKAQSLLPNGQEYPPSLDNATSAAATLMVRRSRAVAAISPCGRIALLK